MVAVVIVVTDGVAEAIVTCTSIVDTAAVVAVFFWCGAAAGVPC